MAVRRPDTASVATLRAVIFRLSNTDPPQLPQVAPQIAASLWNCRDLLSSPVDSKLHGEAAILANRFNAQVYSLLQGRSVPGRWAAVVITKAAIEAGGFEVLSKCNAWVRSLLDILKRSDSSSTRRLTTIVLTRIFVLTWTFSNLVREITTPALPTFISTCLNTIETKRYSAGELQTILDAFNTLLARHTTVFRTYETAIRKLSVLILSETSSAVGTWVHYTTSHRSSARRLLVLLHTCAAKQGAGEKWDETLNNVLGSAHAVCDHVFRSVKEDWKSITGVKPPPPSKKILHGDVSSESVDDLGLTAWKGIEAGAERLVVLLTMLQSCLETPTGATISFSVCKVIDLLDRLLSVRVPRTDQNGHIRPNHEVPNEERGLLFSVIPIIHSTAIDACRILVRRFRNVSVPVRRILFEMIVYAFPAGQAHMNIRLATYAACDAIIQLSGPAMSQHDVADLVPVLKNALADVLPDPATNSTAANLLNASTDSSKPGSGHSSSPGSMLCNPVPEDVQNAAASLIQHTLTNIPAACLGAKLRAQIDRTAVLLQHKGLLFVSVLNPPVKPGHGRLQPSLLPFLARRYSQDPEVESLLRPRLPPIRAEGHNIKDSGDEDWHEHESPSHADEQDAEPTLGFPGALTQEAERLVVTPSTQTASADTLPLLADHPSTSKRPAAHDSGDESLPKRTKASIIAEKSGSIIDRLLPGSDINVDYDESLTVVTTGESRGNQINVAQDTSMQGRSPTIATVNIRPGEDKGLEDADSDAGTPPLTMEPDTDSEEDEDT